jgi:hypothetical protein
VRIFICFEANKTVFIRFIRIKANLHVLQGKRIEKGEANICFKANVYSFLYKVKFLGRKFSEYFGKSSCNYEKFYAS